MSRSLKIDQVADAFNTVPSVALSMLRHVSTNSDALTSSSWADMGVGGNQVTGSFVAAVAGQYAFWLSPRNILTGNYSQLRFRVVFDAGTGDEQTIGVDDVNSDITDANRNSASFPGLVELSAGSHTVKVQYKLVSGAGGAAYSSGFSGVDIFAILASGSGAGGKLASSFRSMDQNDDLVSTSFVPVQDSLGDVSISVDCVSGELITITGVFSVAEITSQSSYVIGIGVDGADPDDYHTVRNTLVNGEYTSDSFSFEFGPLLAGSHTFRMMAKRTVGSGTLRVYGGVAGIPYTNMRVIQYRGGQVPVDKDDVPVLDTPRAFNFVGQGCQVTNVGGRANISLVGADGIESVSSELSANFSQAVTAYNFIDIPNLPSISVNTNEGEYVIVSFVGFISSGATDCNVLLRIDVDGTPYPANVVEGLTYGRNLSFSNPIGPLSAGNHTIKLQITASIGATLSSNILIGSVDSTPKLSVIKIIGGYTHPDNIPILEYSSASQVSIKSAPGASGELRALLNDGKRYTATSPLTLDLTVSGLGGLDTGSEAVSTWYYVYLVPSATAGVMDVVCSVTAPGSGGPTGYDIWKYIGTIRNDSSGNILEFFQAGNRFHYRSWQQVFGSGLAPDVDWTSISLTAFVPVTANLIIHELVLGCASGQTAELRVAPYSASTSCCMLASGTFATIYNVAGQFETPIVTPQTVWRYLIRPTGTGNLNWAEMLVSGWQDGWLSGEAQAQAQAPYQADTKSPLGTWATTTTVGFGARPGQPSTTRLTLQDGVQRYMTTGTWDVANGIADWGYDEAGSQGNSKWLYFYAVPKSGDNTQVVVRASDNAPSVGPAGYSNWRLVWATYINGSGNLLKVFQIGNHFSWAEVKVPSASSGWGTSFQDPKVEIAIDDCVPLSAGAADSYGTLEVNAAGTAGVAQQIYVEGETNWYINIQLNDAKEKARQSTSFLPLPGTSSKKIGYRTNDAGSGASIQIQNFEVLGWLDSWIDT